MVMDLPPGRSHLAEAGGLGRLDLSCWARTTSAAAVTRRMALLKMRNLRMTVNPSRSKDSKRAWRWRETGEQRRRWPGISEQQSRRASRDQGSVTGAPASSKGSPLQFTHLCVLTADGLRGKQSPRDLSDSFQ